MTPQEVEHVYLIGPKEGSVGKIGRSTEVERRLRTLQNSSPTNLQLLWSTPGGKALENALHRHFAPIRLHGEWFDFGCQDRVEAVSNVVATLDDLDLLVEDAKPSPARENALIDRNVRRARLMPVYGPNTIFREDPKGRRVKGWAELNLDVDYHVSSKDRESPETDLRCWCGHQMGSHTAVRPHACGGSTLVGTMWDDCLCLGYEGPLPTELLGYDLPGHNWGLWKAS